MVLDNPELIIPSEALIRLLNLAAQETECEYFGVLLSKHLDLSTLGPIGLLIQYSDTVGDALHLLFQYGQTRFQLIQMALQVEGDSASWISQIKINREDPNQFILVSAGLGLTLMRSLCGEDWQPVEYHSTFERPEFANIVS